MRRPRLFPFRVLGSVAILASVWLLAQSGLAPLSNPPAPKAQSAHPSARATTLPQSNAPALKTHGPRPGPSPQTSGLQFQPVASYGSGAYDPFSVAVADVNGDGKLDLLVANECVTMPICPNGEVGVLLGNGDGTFQPALSFYSGGNWSSCHRRR